MGLESLTIKTKCKTGHLHNAARARSNTKWCRRGYESTSGLHGMELHAVGLSWDAWCRRNQMGRCSKAWNKMGTLHRFQKPAVWHFCRFENCCSYCLSMSSISMMLISTTRGDFAQPHGLETERDGNTAQMSATCSVVLLYTLKSSPNTAAVCTVCTVCAVCTVYAVHILYSMSHRGGWFAQCVFFLDICLHCFIYIYNLIISGLLLTDTLVRAIS